MKTKFKIGDKVTSKGFKNFGIGIISEIKDHGKYPIIVDFPNGQFIMYTSGGFYSYGNVEPDLQLFKED